MQRSLFGILTTLCVVLGGCIADSETEAQNVGATASSVTTLESPTPHPALESPSQPVRPPPTTLAAPTSPPVLATPTPHPALPSPTPHSAALPLGESTPEVELPDR